MNEAATPLLTDLYQLNMIQAYLDHGQTDTAVFEFFVRKLPSRRFLLACGLGGTGPHNHFFAFDQDQSEVIAPLATMSKSC